MTQEIIEVNGNEYTNYIPNVGYKFMNKESGVFFSSMVLNDSDSIDNYTEVTDETYVASTDFNSFDYETYLRNNIQPNILAVKSEAFLFIRCLDNRTFKSAFETLVGLLATEGITEDNYNICIAGLAEQGLYLSDYITTATDE